jgi:hypothetical protein
MAGARARPQQNWVLRFVRFVEARRHLP